MSKKDIHVVPHKDGWAVKKEGGERVPYTTANLTLRNKLAIKEDGTRSKL